MTKEILLENNKEELGTHLYLGMGLTSNGHKIVMSIGYNIDYSFKKGMQHQNNSGSVLTHISKIRIPDTICVKKFKV